ncbi:MAG: universal stress protein [Jatrophihabitans sp.]|nr:MAG: universal stress protein [Jatrophihabitans sp.]
MTSGTVLVGLGRLGGAGETALEWAADEAHARGARLVVVRTYRLAGGGEDARTAALDLDLLRDLRRSAELHLVSGLDRLRRRHPDLPVGCYAVEGRPAQVLGRLSAAALLTVVGNRRVRRIGSVNAALAAAAHGPVVATGARRPPPAARPAIVVALDGGADTDEVLAFAFDRAARYRRPVCAVTSRTPAGVPWVPDRAYAALGEWRSRCPGVEVELRVVTEPAPEAYLAACAGQDLLVIGNRARHPTAARSGPLSRGLLRRAGCPVAVIHPRTPVRDAAAQT